MIVLAVVVALSISAGIFIQRWRSPDPHAHSLYIISVSRVALALQDKWLVEYSLDGHAEAVELPIKASEPQGYLDYLEGVRNGK